MQQCGLNSDLNRHVRKYSLGMRQRLGIAQAIQKEMGKTIIISSHNKEDIEILCDHVFEMEDGRLSLHQSL